MEELSTQLWDSHLTTTTISDSRLEESALSETLLLSMYSMNLLFSRDMNRELIQRQTQISLRLCWILQRYQISQPTLHQTMATSQLLRQILLALQSQQHDQLRHLLQILLPSRIQRLEDNLSRHQVLG